ncbi:hypothetical protein F0562_003979 [Nyssa sinensis]|uniref:Retrotransposon gag domain-containing protein n=1 Tax=Nyssa sinensis TaxID=561372 RepID=A0A5J5C050_9ASTE|nr:hypothetical protein F0562_003979 [Nyssa sinensis]
MSFKRSAAISRSSSQQGSSLHHSPQFITVIVAESTIAQSHHHHPPNCSSSTLAVLDHLVHHTVPSTATLLHRLAITTIFAPPLLPPFPSPSGFINLEEIVRSTSATGSTIREGIGMSYEEEDIAKKVKVVAPRFDGRLDLSAFLDKLANIEDSFDWYGIADTQCVQFFKMKLVRSAKRYWQGVQENIECLGEPPITLWAEMKLKLKGKYIPTYYRRQLLEQWMTLRQVPMSVSNYLVQFDLYSMWDR